MNKQLLEELMTLSFEGKITFPEVVKRLATNGFERYRVDLVRMEKVSYHASGDSFAEKMAMTGTPAIAADFSLEDVKKAIKAAQQSEVSYPDFLRRIMAAGCSSYVVYIDGKQVIYFGRKGDMHVEKFPTAKS